VDRTTGAPLAGSQQASPPYRILIFDIAANLDLLSTTDISASREGIELLSDVPDERGIFTVSDDQSYLYYVETVREQRGDRPVVDILDLTAAPRVTATVRLSSTNECDAFSLYPFGASSMIVNCSSYNSPKAPGAVMVLTPDGSLGDSIGAEGLAGTIPGTSRPWPVAGTFALPGNGIGLVYLNGAYAVYNGSAPTLAGRALSDDDLMYGAEGEVTTLDSSHVVLAYWPGPQLPQDPRQAAAGFSVFNTATGSIEKDSKVDNYGVYGISSHEVAIVKRESVELLDLDTMKTEWSLQTALPEHPDVLPRVRVAH
jgi:hypothetical protein